MSDKVEVTIAGAGSWGTTLAIMLASRDIPITLWEYRPEAVRQMEIDRENREFLPGYLFPPKIRLNSDLQAAAQDADFLLIAVPSHAVRSTVARLSKGVPDKCIVISATKGIEEGSLLRMSEVLLQVWGGNVSADRIVALSGPSHAEEVILGQPTTVVAAAHNIESAHQAQRLLSSERFRVYAHNDVMGVELGGALKNIIAIASGIAEGLSFGDNTRGALLTRGLAEITRLGVQLGGRPATFAGLSGMGDLITTCMSQHSRNRFVGEQIGRGRKLRDILAGMTMVAEGVRTTNSAYDLARREDIVMPITEQVHRILFEDVDPLQATMELMTRRLKVED
ncbi:MAG: NAD(P)-dependent glycerol-3-phosphate dehydrogenase [Calditrichaeota bacterium]|nr:NAD(P)-dependent glycerol-3-phosphate dehydrogenase [Calditrichota bacterium]